MAATILISILLLAAVAGIIRSLAVKKKNGQSGCGCGCGGCALSERCHRKKD